MRVSLKQADLFIDGVVEFILAAMSVDMPRPYCRFVNVVIFGNRPEYIWSQERIAKPELDQYNK